jgi:hypothetical protein
VSVSELAPGDLCTIVRTEFDSPADVRLGIAGLTVVLICEEPPSRPWQDRYAPFWRCSGMPAGYSGVSWLSLRKIPPAPMADEPTEEELIV